MARYVEGFKNPTFVNRATGRVMPNDTGWQDRHMSAIRNPQSFEIAIVGMIETWAKYADVYRIRHGSDSRLNDYVIGAAWKDIGRGILAILNGDTGRLDCGTLDAFIRDTLQSEGWRDD